MPLSPKLGSGFPVAMIDGDQLLAEGRDENAFDLAVGPVLDAAGLQRLHIRLALGVALGVVEPQLFPGRGVEGRYLAVGGSGIHTSANHERRGPVVAGVVAPAVAVRDVLVGGLPPPGDLELREVPGVDLGQGGVLRGGVVTAVVAPFAPCSAVGGGGRQCRANHRSEADTNN